VRFTRFCAGPKHSDSPINCSHATGLTEPSFVKSSLTAVGETERIGARPYYAQFNAPGQLVSSRVYIVLGDL